jgi:hypothetical protein
MSRAQTPVGIICLHPTFPEVMVPGALIANRWPSTPSSCPLQGEQGLDRSSSSLGRRDLQPPPPCLHPQAEPAQRDSAAPAAQGAQRVSASGSHMHLIYSIALGLKNTR